MDENTTTGEGEERRTRGMKARVTVGGETFDLGDADEAMSKLKQLEIPGAGRKRIKSLDGACADLIAARLAKREATRLEQTASMRVQLRLGEHNLESYVFVDGDNRFLVSRETTEKARMQQIGRRERGENDTAS